MHITGGVKQEQFVLLQDFVQQASGSYLKQWAAMVRDCYRIYHWLTLLGRTDWPHMVEITLRGVMHTGVLQQLTF